MRISTFKDDPDFVDDAWAYSIYIDNRRLDDCVCADEERGIAWIKGRGNGPDIELRGKVCIIPELKK